MSRSAYALVFGSTAMFDDESVPSTNPGRPLLRRPVPARCQAWVWGLGSSSVPLTDLGSL